jgi:hypothetical protein
MRRCWRGEVLVGRFAHGVHCRRAQPQATELAFSIKWFSGLFHFTLSCGQTFTTVRHPTQPTSQKKACAWALGWLLCTAAWAQPSATVPPAAPASVASAPASAASAAPAAGPRPDASPAEKAAYTQALAQCEAELRTDYARKIENAVATGRPHLVPVYERRRGEALASLCPSQAENAAADQRIAANRADIAAADQRIAAIKRIGELFDHSKRIADKITNNTATPADAAELENVYQSLKAIHASSPDKGIAEVLPLLEGVLIKARRLRN